MAITLLAFDLETGRACYSIPGSLLNGNFCTCCCSATVEVMIMLVGFIRGFKAFGNVAGAPRR
jgi:hypothetical protein